jgi:hypothetical protein
MLAGGFQLTWDICKTVFAVKAWADAVLARTMLLSLDISVVTTAQFSQKMDSSGLANAAAKFNRVQLNFP